MVNYVYRLMGNPHQTNSSEAGIEPRWCGASSADRLNAWNVGRGVCLRAVGRCVVRGGIAGGYLLCLFSAADESGVPPWKVSR